MSLALAVDLDLDAARQRVHDGDADTVQATRDLVPTATELPTRMEDRHDDLGR